MSPLNGVQRIERMPREEFREKIVHGFCEMEAFNYLAAIGSKMLTVKQIHDLTEELQRIGIIVQDNLDEIAGVICRRIVRAD